MGAGWCPGGGRDSGGCPRCRLLLRRRLLYAGVSAGHRFAPAPVSALPGAFGPRALGSLSGGLARSLPSRLGQRRNAFLFWYRVFLVRPAGCPCCPDGYRSRPHESLWPLVPIPGREWKHGGLRGDGGVPARLLFARCHEPRDSVRDGHILFILPVTESGPQCAPVAGLPEGNRPGAQSVD